MRGNGVDDKRRQSATASTVFVAGGPVTAIVVDAVDAVGRRASDGDGGWWWWMVGRG